MKLLKKNENEKRHTDAPLIERYSLNKYNEITKVYLALNFPLFVSIKVVKIKLVKKKEYFYFFCSSAQNQTKIVILKCDFFKEKITKIKSYNLLVT